MSIERFMLDDRKADASGSTVSGVVPNEADRGAIAEARHGDPFAVLGPHECADGDVCVRVYRPEAETASVVADDGRVLAELAAVGPPGFFAGSVPGLVLGKPYRLRFTRAGDTWEQDDPYRFGSRLGETDLHLIGEGNHYRLYEKLGAHPETVDGVDGVTFAVLAPAARRVSVVGNFNGWDGRRNPMRRHPGVGVWDIFMPGVALGESYKFEIMGPDGTVQPLKADPVGFCQEVAPNTASVVTGLVEHEWRDEAFQARPHDWQSAGKPVSIYEVHLGSWARGENDSFLDYDALGAKLSAYCADMGFTHVEFMPVSEHPFYGSWGYQPIGLFAPSSRYGDPAGFARLVDRLHQAGIGVLVDWVPAHFPTDTHGLSRFDGTALYEHPDPRRGFHNDWNTLIYDYGRPTVKNFLVANALYWIDRFHVDGLRVDAVASMLYLDYSRDDWEPNIHGGRENLEAIAFLKDFNERMGEYYPVASTHAEESTAYPNVSRPTYAGGLGFHFKWNLGWMHDTLDYMAEDPINRSHHHDKITFGLHYAFSENFILPLSHDEVVYGKGSLIRKMPGDRWRQFANLRAYYGFMWTHPGKKLIFMGGEFAQDREWNHDNSLDWHLLDNPENAGVQSLVRDLNGMYRSTPALYERDGEESGFEWVDASDRQNSVFAYLRKDAAGDCVLVVANFTPQVHHGYRIGVPSGGVWAECMNTDAEIYGGSNVGNMGGVEAEARTVHGRPYSLPLTLPPLATIVLRPKT